MTATVTEKYFSGDGDKKQDYICFFFHRVGYVSPLVPEYNIKNKLSFTVMT